MKNHKAQAAKILQKILLQDGSLAVHLTNETPARVKHYCYQVCRHYYSLQHLSLQLLDKKPRNKDLDVFCVLLIGLQSLQEGQDPEYAIVSDSVNACQSLNKKWAKGLINKTLRAFISTKESCQEQSVKTPESQHDHPTWLIHLIQKHYPDNWQTILTENNQKPPLTIRVNAQQLQAESYQQKYHLPAKPLNGLKQALCFAKAIPAVDLPGFAEGLCSVQDGSAQLAAELLVPKETDRILDACAAPGGKTGHLLEQAPKAHITALDISANRCDKIRSNLNRLQLHADVKTADATNLEAWWDKQTFDKILIDAPCSATGILRRQPDIKLLRQPEDIALLHEQQLRLLQALWPTLKPGGTLLYATCSILPQENDKTIEAFCTKTSDAVLETIELPFGHPTQAGWQILPGQNHCDGFFYSKVKKILP